MAMKYGYHGAHERGRSDTLERTFQKPAKPTSPAVVGYGWVKGNTRRMHCLVPALMAVGLGLMLKCNQSFRKDVPRMYLGLGD